MTEPRDGWSKADIVAGVLTPILIFIFGTMYSCQQRKADEVQKTADRVTSLVKSLHSDKSDERLAALVLLRKEKQKHPEEVPDELLVGTVPTLVNIAVNDPNAEVSKQAQQLVNEFTAKSDPTLAETMRQNVENLPARMYIHIREERQRGPAEQIESKLEGQDLNVPSIRRVNNGPNVTELRFFRNAEENEVNELVSLLRTLNVADVQAKYIPGHEDSKAMRPRHYELWLSLTALGNNSR